MLDDWRCNHLLRPRNLALRSTLYVAIIFASFIIAVFVLRATDQQVLQQLLNALPLLENHRNFTIGGNQQQHQIRTPSQQRPAAPQQPARHQQQHTSIILYWTKFFETSDFEVGLGSKPFGSCSIDRVNSTSSFISNCLTTTDRGLLNDSDAVIFHGRDLHVEDLPPPGWRRPHQIFVFFLLESPVHTNLGLLRQPVFRHYFNRTMTYRRDSDVVILYAYGRLRCISIDPSASRAACLEFPRNAGNDSVIAAALEHQQHSSDAPAASVLLFPPANNLTVVTISGKDRAVAWFVSNCQSNSQRESLVRRLSQFIAVDIYGKCGDGKQHSCPNRSECDRMLSRHYRFYLSFENSLCPDYVTEKLYRPLAHDAVPVVYGGADYSAYLPAGSYVDARHFENPEALADHLKKIMANDTLYSSYFDWKSQYVVDPTPMDGWCRLCQLLNEPLSNTQKEKTFVVDDMASWWSGQTTNQTCSPPPKSLIV